MAIRTTVCAVIFALFQSVALACGTADNACEVPLGSYFVAEPETRSAQPRPAVFFFHGGGGWGSRIFKLRAEMTADFNRRGYVVIAPNGSKRPGSKWGPGWAFIPQFEPHRDDLAFTKQVIQDAENRFNIDPQRLLMTGYSIGGSRTSYFACQEPDLARAYAPVAGAFWWPHPEDCNGPVRLLHTHGWRDQTVPLEGRPIRDTGIRQGDVHMAMMQWREENGCAKLRPDTFVTDGLFWRRVWTDCNPGTALEFALHPGGHEVPGSWATMVMDWFEELE